MTILFDSCYRCGDQAHLMTMSWFNTDIICISCADAEKKLPGFREAVEAERRAVMAGNFNFEGVGLPVKNN